MRRALAIIAVVATAAGLVHFLQERQRRAWAGRGGARGYYEGEPVPDDVLEQRVRASLAPIGKDLIDARVSGGTVVLRGAIPRQQRDRALAAVLAVPGVTQVANYLEAEGAPLTQPGA